jgi:hypothetical protein
MKSSRWTSPKASTRRSDRKSAVLANQFRISFPRCLEVSIWQSSDHFVQDSLQTGRLGVTRYEYHHNGTIADTVAAADRKSGRIDSGQRVVVGI